MKLILVNLDCISENIDLNKYIEFREIVKDNMKHPEWLGDFTKEDLSTLLDNGTKIWMYYMGNEPVCSMMAIPSTKKDLDKFGIDLDCQEVMDYGPLMVGPTFWGNGLQYQMMEVLDKYSINNGYRYAVATIHPDNILCLNNVKKENFEFVKDKEFSRGMRKIYLKKLI